MDPNNPDAFAPYMRDAVKEVMRINALAPSKLGYHPSRYSDYHKFGWWPNQWLRGLTEPQWAVVNNAPEYHILNDKRISKSNEVNLEAMEYVESVVARLDTLIEILRVGRVTPVIIVTILYGYHGY